MGFKVLSESGNKSIVTVPSYRPDIDGEAEDDYSGGSVSMNSAGDRVAIGAIENDGTATNAGHVRVYEYSNSSWTQLGSDIDVKLLVTFPVVQYL